MAHVSKFSKLLRYSLAFSAVAGTAFAAGCSDADDEQAAASGDDTAPVGEVQSALVVSPDLVISQVYGGGGNTNAIYTHDFIEIFNRGTTAASLNGKSLQYASGTGNFSASSNVVPLPNVSVAAGGYFLVQLSTGGAVGSALPTPDLVTSGTQALTLSKDKGKVALVPSNALLDGCGGTGSPCPSGNWIDFVAYGGSTANDSQFEGSAPAGLTTNSTSATRLGAGCQDTGDNGFDFQVQTPAAHNSASTVVDCSTYDGGTPPPFDAGVDTGTPVDAGTSDTGTVTDASTGTDASTPTDGGTTKSDAGSTKTDAGSTKSDAGSSSGDAGGTTSGGSDAGSTKKDAGKATAAASSDAPSTSSDSGGCAVATTGGNTNASGGLGLTGLALALVGLGRRRRR